MKVSYLKFLVLLVYQQHRHLRAHFCAKGEAILLDVDFLHSLVDSLLVLREGVTAIKCNLRAIVRPVAHSLSCREIELTSNRYQMVGMW
jgi:hypothetical protein